VKFKNHEAPYYDIFSKLPLIPFNLVPNFLGSTIFTNTLDELSSLNVTDYVLHLHKTKAKITVPKILIFLALILKTQKQDFELSNSGNSPNRSPLINPFIHTIFIC
jgi:hypothetical protein